LLQESEVQFVERESTEFVVKNSTEILRRLTDTSERTLYANHNIEFNKQSIRPFQSRFKQRIPSILSRQTELHSPGANYPSSLFATRRQCPKNLLR